MVAMEAEEDQEEVVAMEVPELMEVTAQDMVVAVIVDQVEVEAMEAMVAMEPMEDQEVEEEMEVTLVMVASVLSRHRIHDCSC